MAEDSEQRSALMEIPEPQAKLTGRLRRSYMDILCSRRTAGGKQRTRRCSITHTHTHTVNTHSYTADDHQTNDSKQLLNSLRLAEQSVCVLSADVRVLLCDLQQKKSSVFISIPYSRLASNRDARCYRKAQPHLLAFRRSCQEGGRCLLQDSQWAELLQFVLSAWRYTSELPRWERSTHNALQEHCYNTLAAYCCTALQKHTPPARRARALLRRFRAVTVCKRVVSPCVQQLEKILQEYQSGETHTPMETRFRPAGQHTPVM